MLTAVSLYLRLILEGLGWRYCYGLYAELYACVRVLTERIDITVASTLPDHHCGCHGAHLSTSNLATGPWARILVAIVAIKCFVCTTFPRGVASVLPSIGLLVAPSGFC